MARKGCPADRRLLQGCLVVPAYAVFGTKRPPVQIRPPRQENGRSRGSCYLLSAIHLPRCPILGASWEQADLQSRDHASSGCAELPLHSIGYSTGLIVFSR